MIGIVSGYSGGKTDAVIGRVMDLTLAPPFLLIILALSGVLTQRLTSLGVPEGNPSRILYMILVFSVVPSYLFIPGVLLVTLVVTFNLVGDAVRDALDPRAGRR